MFNSEDIEIFEKLRDKFNLIEDNGDLSTYRYCCYPDPIIVGSVIVMFEDERGVNVAANVFDGIYGPEYSGLMKYGTYEAAERQVEKILKETNDILEHRKKCVKFSTMNAIKHAGDSWEIA